VQKADVIAIAKPVAAIEEQRQAIFVLLVLLCLVVADFFDLDS
jgi:hypothetical protein